MKKQIIGIFLCIVLVFPTISAAVAIDNDQQFVEITTEFYGLDYSKNNIVKLTQNDLNKLEELFSSIQERCDIAETREEINEIYTDVLFVLDELGLLGDLTINEVKQLITSEFKVSDLYKPKINLIPNEDTTNIFCFVAGKAHTSFISGLTISKYIREGIFLQLFWFIYEYFYLPYSNLALINNLADFLFPFIIFRLELFNIFQDLSVKYDHNYRISSLWARFGCDLQPEYQIENGFLFTLGLNGRINKTHQFNARFLGFKGISISTDPNGLSNYFIGHSAVAMIDNY